jgi:DNA-binding response OmpR family regulator
LALRVRAILARYAAEGPEPAPARELRAGALRLDLDELLAEHAGVQARLTPLEGRILHILLANAGRVVPHARMVEFAWGLGEGDGDLLKSHITHLRQKLRLPRSGPGSIQARLGVGYCLVVEPTRAP